MSVFRRKILAKRWIIDIESTNFVRPLGDLIHIKAYDGSDELSILVNDEKNFIQPTSVIATYANNNISGSITYGGFIPTITSSNTSIVSIGTPFNGVCSFTCKEEGVATITVKNGSLTIQTYTINITNANNVLDVSNEVSYCSDNENLQLINLNSNFVYNNILYLSEGQFNDDTITLNQGEIQDDMLVL